MATSNTITLTSDPAVPLGDALVKHGGGPGSNPDYYAMAPATSNDMANLINHDPFITEITFNPADLSTYNKSFGKTQRVYLSGGAVSNYAWVPANPAYAPQLVPTQLMFPEFEASEPPPAKPAKCECGSASVGSQHHSDWCPAKIAG